MGKLKLILSILWEEKFKRLCMSLIIVLLIVSSNISISLISEMEMMDKLISMCNFENAIYYSDGMSLLSNEMENEQVDILPEKVAENGMISYSLLGMEQEDGKSFQTVNCYVYNEVLCNHIKLPLQSGNWFSKNAKSEQEVILSSDFKKEYQIGDVLEKTIIDENEKTWDVKLKVIGFLEDENNIMDFSCSGSIDISDIVVNSKNTMIVQEMNDIEGKTIPFITGCSSGTMFFLKETLTEEQKHKIRQQGSYQHMDEIVAAYQENNKEKLYEQIGIEIVILFLAISGLGSSNFLTMYERRKEYGIYFICGLEKRSCMLFTTALNGITLMISAIISLELYFIDSNKIMSLSLKHIGISLGIIIAIYIVSSIPFWIVMSKESPICLTKE